MNKKIYGLGINDADYTTQTRAKGEVKYWKCPFYERWTNMLKRCYSQVWMNSHPTYIGCNVCEDWLRFSNFKKWMEQQNWEGKHLDKDILIKGNKTYSPKACMFVAQEVNKLFADSGAARGNFPQGVYIDKINGKFKAQISKRGMVIGLGYFDNKEGAENEYIKEKRGYILEIVENLKDEDPRLKPALIRISENLTK